MLEEGSKKKPDTGDMTDSILCSVDCNKVSKNPNKKKRGTKQENSEPECLKKTVEDNGIVANAWKYESIKKKRLVKELRRDIEQLLIKHETL